jgi:hypothetical protein
MALTLAVAACGPRREQPTPTAAPAAVPVPAGTPYAVAAERSEITVLVYRAGPLGRLGHNHVVVARKIAGTIWAGAGSHTASFALRLPVAEFVVDAPAERRAAGVDFPGEIPQADIDGTRRNMLSDALLDGDHSPEIRLESLAIAGTATDVQVRARVTVRGLDTEIEFPARITRAASQILAEGEFPLLQSQLGLQPFSVMLGALQVQDELLVKFRIVAVHDSQ